MNDDGGDEMPSYCRCPISPSEAPLDDDNDDGGDEMPSYCRCPISPSELPLDDENLLGEILLRLPLQPSSLPRASLVCKPWRCLATNASFLRRFRSHHRKPPILGVFEKHGRDLVFTSVLDPPNRIPCERFSLRVRATHDFWSVLGCRHGRVLIFSWKQREILVFDPVSGDRCTMAVPPEFLGEKKFDITVNGAVLCAAGDDLGHVHGSCHQSPFKVVLVGTRRQQLALARVYSSATRIWGVPVLAAEPCTGYVITSLPCTFVGNALYWWLTKDGDGILEFDLDSQSLAVIKKPPAPDIHSGCSRIITGDDGGVRLAVLLYPSLQIWDRKVDSDAIATWVLHETFNMNEILDLPYDMLVRRALIVGYSEDTEAIFVSVGTMLHGSYFFIVRLESMQPRRLRGNFLDNSYHPFSIFYTVGPPLLQLPAAENYVWGDANRG